MAESRQKVFKENLSSSHRVRALDDKNDTFLIFFYPDNTAQELWRGLCARGASNV